MILPGEALITVSQLIPRPRGSPEPLGLVPKVPSPPPTSTHPRSRGQGAPGHSCGSVPIAPSPGATAGSRLLACQLLLSPELLLGLQRREDMETERREERSGPEGSQGPARVATLFMGSLEGTYMVRKRTSSHHKTQPRFSVARPGTPELT